MTFLFYWLKIPDIYILKVSQQLCARCTHTHAHTYTIAGDVFKNSLSGLWIKNFTFSQVFPNLLEGFKSSQRYCAQICQKKERVIQTAAQIRFSFLLIYCEYKMWISERPMCAPVVEETLIVSVYTLEQPLFAPLFLICRYKIPSPTSRRSGCSLKPHLFGLHKSQEPFAGGNSHFLCQAKVHADITFSSCLKMSSPVLAIFAVIYCEVNVPCLVGEYEIVALRWFSVSFLFSSLFSLAFIISYSTHLWSVTIHQSLFSGPDYV